MSKREEQGASYDVLVQGYVRLCAQLKQEHGLSGNVQMVRRDDGYWLVQAVQQRKPSCLWCGSLMAGFVVVDVRATLAIPPIFARVCDSCGDHYAKTKASIAAEEAKNLN